jgi:hypothetical protein
MGGACGTYWEKTNKCTGVAGEETRVDDLGYSRSGLLKLLDLSGSGYGEVAAFFNTVMNLWVLKNVRNFFDLLRDRWLLKNDSAPYS